MCNLKDVLSACNGSGATIVTAIYEYGNGNLGEGVRRIAYDMFEQGINEITPIAIGVGYCQGFDDGYLTGSLQGYDSGQINGIFKGSIFTVATIGVIGLSTWGISKYVKKKKKQKELSNNQTTTACEPEQSCM